MVQGLLQYIFETQNVYQNSQEMYTLLSEQYSRNLLNT